MNTNVLRHTVHLIAAVLFLTIAVSDPAKASEVDDFPGYEPQTTCASAPLPGTTFLLRWLNREYGDHGSSWTMRGCHVGGVSEHKDGRALDWAADATDPKQRAQVNALLHRLFAPDGAGNPDALARRMGIMYIIWNDHMYRAYDWQHRFAADSYLSSGCRSVKKCSKTLRHRDHVHISLSWSGASAQTSFYRSRNAHPVPVLLPGTKRLDPARTAVAKVEVPAAGKTVTTAFKLIRGTTYRVVADGLYRYGPGARVSDAACVWSRHGWAPSRNGLRLNGTSPWTTSAETCRDGHTHAASYTPKRTGYLKLRIGDDTRADNAGSVSFYVLRDDVPTRSVATQPARPTGQPRLARAPGPRAKRLVKEALTLRASARHGVRTDRALRKGKRYHVVVTGQARSGGTAFDGNCVRYAGRFRPQESLDLARPDADHLSLFIAGKPVTLHVPGADRACDGRTHRYRGTFAAPVTGRATVKIWDPYSYRDNSGALGIKLILAR